MIEYSIVIPAYDEALRICKTLGLISGFFAGKGWSYEIIVADDGSVDDTAIQVSEMAESLPELKLLKLRHQGKGGAVHAGVEAAKGNYILMCDADLSTPIEEIEKLRAALDSGNNLAVGSRRAEGARLARLQPRLRQTAGQAFGFFTRLFIPTGVLDTQCGFKLFSAQAAQRLFSYQTATGFAFDLEILALARKMEMKIAEVPVTWMDADGSKVNPVKHLPQVTWEVLKIRWSLWQRRGLGRD